MVAHAQSIYSLHLSVRQRLPTNVSPLISHNNTPSKCTPATKPCSPLLNSTNNSFCTPTFPHLPSSSHPPVAGLPFTPQLILPKTLRSAPSSNTFPTCALRKRMNDYASIGKPYQSTTRPTKTRAAPSPKASIPSQIIASTLLGAWIAMARR